MLWLGDGRLATGSSWIWSPCARLLGRKGVDTPAREIIGTGPFQFFQYMPGQRTLLVRNTKYWKVDRAGNRLPYLARAVVEIVPNLEASRLKFEARETDVYGVRPSEFTVFKQREREGNYTIYELGPTDTISFLAFNQNPAGVKPPKLDWFSNQKFRQAVAHAIDRQTIIQQVLAGRGIPLWGPESSANPIFHNPAVRQYPFDLQRAQALLEEVGLRKGADGALRDAAGNTVEFLLTTVSGSSDWEAIGNILRTDLTKLGMKVTYAPEAFNTLVGKLTGTFNWEALIIGLGGGGIDPHNSQNVWKSSGSLHLWYPNQGTPATGWEAEIDRIFDQGATTVNEDRRKQLYARWQEIAAEQVPLIMLPTSLAQTAVRNTVANIRARPYGGTLWNIEELFYTQAYR